MSNSKKRSAEGDQGRKGELAETNELDELEFEDPYYDDIEEEEDAEEMIDGEQEMGAEVEQSNTDAAGPPQVAKQVWRSGVQKLEDIEELEYDPSAYIMYHSMQTEWPCLSFDFLKDDLGDTRHRVRLNLSQSANAQSNSHFSIYLIFSVSSHHVPGHWISSRSRR